MMNILPTDVVGFLKPTLDVHTLGISMASNLLKECGYKTILANDDINNSVQEIWKINNYTLVKKWILSNNITFIGFSYRLDPKDGSNIFLRFVNLLKNDNMLLEDGGLVKFVFFGGLEETCILIKKESPIDVSVFKGGETIEETLFEFGIPKDKMPKVLFISNVYDNFRWNFAKEIVSSEKYKFQKPLDHGGYISYGSNNDSFVDRLEYARKKGSLPIIRAHVGPYGPNREEVLKEFNSWVKQLSMSFFLDVLSIGSSQLTQSHFGQNWDNLPNGGGVPINSFTEYNVVREVAKPMLVRTYAGTNNVPKLAEIHEKSLNIAWHALSFWWFCELDGRGNNSLLDNLKEHFETIKYIVYTNKPLEPNVPHHFAFRGADDITYIISGFLAAKAAKIMGIKYLILQNMLNTPKYTVGVQDLAKGRVMLKLVRELEDSNFKVSLQLRAGLDYFQPDIDKAKIQLAAVTTLMDDIEPDNENSPEIIHVVSYSEALCLATPPIVIDSIKITLSTLYEYRKAKKIGLVPNMKYDADVIERYNDLYSEAKDAIIFLERNIKNLYTPEGFYILFKEGFFPTPYLLDPNNSYPKAKKSLTAFKNGGIRVVDEEGNIINTLDRYKKIIGNIH